MHVQHLMKPLQAVSGESIIPEGLFPKEAISEIERLKNSVHHTQDWLQDVSKRGDEAIEQIFKVHTDAFDFLLHISQFIEDYKKVDESIADEMKIILQIPRDELAQVDISPHDTIDKVKGWLEVWN